MSERRDYGREFEEEVADFLKTKLGFSHVKKGQNFHIAAPGETNQVDVAGRFNDILFVFQCKAAGRRVKRNMKEEMLATIKRSEIILENYKNIPEYQSCKFVVFIFITKKIEIPDIQIKYMEGGSPKIYYATEDLLNYYSDLYEKIGKYAVYNFMSDFGIRPAHYSRMEVAALRTKIKNQITYSFFANPEELLKFSYVARRRSRKEDFYQRMLEKSRIKKIAGFIDGGGMFPTNVVISLRNGNNSFRKVHDPKLPKNIEVGILTIKDSYDACWIIDGQHRLYSYAKSKSKSLIPCTAMEHLTPEDERSFFLEINREQRPIKPDLIWDLEGQAHPDSDFGVISNTVRNLAIEGPFADLIYIPVLGSKEGKKITMAAFCNGIRNARLLIRKAPNCLGIDNPLYTEKASTRVMRATRTLKNYFSLLEEGLNDDQKRYLFGNAGVPVLLYLLEPIVSSIGRIPTKDDLKPYTVAVIKSLKSLLSDHEKIAEIREETNSEGARKNLARRIGVEVKKQIRNNSFWPTLEESRMAQRIQWMERRIGTFIKNELQKQTTSWEKQRVPSDIASNARKKMEHDGTDFDENFDIGDEQKIILRKDNWNDVFKKKLTGKEGFENEEELKLAFGYLQKLRNPDVHMKSVIPGKEIVDQCKIYLAKLDRLIPERLPDDSIEESIDSD